MDWDENPKLLLQKASPLDLEKKNNSKRFTKQSVVHRTTTLNIQQADTHEAQLQVSGSDLISVNPFITLFCPN